MQGLGPELREGQKLEHVSTENKISNNDFIVGVSHPAMA